MSLYFVQIIESRLVTTPEEDTARPARFLDEFCSSIEEAKRAGAAEIARLAKDGVRVRYCVYDQDNRPVEANTSA